MQSNKNNLEDQGDDQEEMNEEEIIAVILELGNKVLRNVGVEELIDDVSVFFSDAFYIQFFMAAFPELDFSQLEEAQNESEMAENIQALIDVLGEQILKYDLSHIKGDEIVSGNPEHCINLLQLVLEISNMLEGKQEGEDMEGESRDVEVVDEPEYEIQKSSQKKGQSSQKKQQQREEEEDSEGDLIYQGKSHLVQQQSSNKKGGSSQKPSSQKRGRSYSDDRGRPQMDEMDDEYGDQLDIPLAQEQEKMRKKQQVHQQQQQEEDEDEEQFDDDDLKMYEQFLANQQDQQHNLMNNAPAGAGDYIQDNYGEEEDMEDELEGFDPELIAAARQMGLNADQIRELQQQLQNQEDEEYGEEGDSQLSENEMQTRMKLIRQKSYSAPYILMSDCFDEALYDSESQILQKACSETMLQGLELKENSDEDQLEQNQYQEQMQELMVQQQQQQNKGNSKITEVSKSKESSSYQQKAYPQSQPVQKKQSPPKNEHSSKKKAPPPVFNQDESDEEDLDVDVDVGQKLKQMQQNQQQLMAQYGEEIDEDYGDEDGEAQQILNQQQQYAEMQQRISDHEAEDEDDENGDKTMLDLDDLDDEEREMLLQYLQQEYEKNPDGFPFPKELLNKDFLRKGNKDEDVRDIQSDEMVVEDAQDGQGEQYQGDQIIGGGQDVEDDGEGEEEIEGLENLTEEQKQQLQYLLQQQQLQEQQQQQMQDYGEEVDENHMQPHFVKKTKKGKRPKSGKSKTQKRQQQQQQIIDEENIDPNLYQQIIMAQSQQQFNQGKPPTAQKKRKPQSGKKQRSNLQKLQPYSFNTKNMRHLYPSTPGNMLKPQTNRTLSQSRKKTKKQKSKEKSKRTIEQQEQQPLQDIQMPIYDEEILNQLTEEQLQQLLNEQQQMMLLQQIQQQQEQQEQYQAQKSAKKRPKSGKRPQTAKNRSKPIQNFGYGQAQKSLYPANSKRLTTKKTKKGTKKKRLQQNNQVFVQDQGIMMNNYFPALENQHMVGNTQTSEDGQAVNKDSKYPKFGNENINNPANVYGGQQDAIAEVSPEQEEAESSEHLTHQFFHPRQNQPAEAPTEEEQQENDQDGQEPGQDEGDQQQDDDGQMEGDENIELSQEQLIQLIQNAQNLTPEQQAQLHQILQEKLGQLPDPNSERAQQYMGIQQMLVDNILRARERYANIGQINSKRTLEEETDQRIIKQKLEFDNLLKEYLKENMVKEQRKTIEGAKLQKQLERESKMQSIMERKFEEELMLQQKSLMYKRNAQQVKLCQQVYKLASELEKNKLLQEKREFKEAQERKKAQKRMMVDAIETYYKDRIQMLKERIQAERFERQIASQAQTQALSRMKKELNSQKRQEIQKYLQILKQEDQKFDFQSSNMGQVERELIKMYKR